MWCIPPQQNAAFVADMEQVLDVYQRPYDPRFPVICMAESNQQLIGDVRPPLPVQAGQVTREDCNYERHGTGNLFIAFEPACGQCHVAVTKHRTQRDWAHFIRSIVDELYPTAERVTRVCDQLNTHCLASLYETFTPDEAQRLARQTGNCAYAQTWQLAQYGRNRIECVESSMFGSPHRRPRPAGARSSSVGAGTKYPCDDGSLAIHHGRRTRKTRITLPKDFALTDYEFACVNQPV
ncbi:hypothetical protein TFLX_04060 [Thermoflexales bacterium]|nr:hypothetical protein TFLX_04060 [Thermoflexales bacterium]